MSPPGAAVSGNVCTLCVDVNVLRIAAHRGRCALRRTQPKHEVFARLLQKAAGSRGGAPWPRSAERGIPLY